MGSGLLLSLKHVTPRTSPTVAQLLCAPKLFGDLIGIAPNCKLPPKRTDAALEAEHMEDSIIFVPGQDIN